MNTPTGTAAGMAATLAILLLLIGLLAAVAGKLPAKLGVAGKRGWTIAHIVLVIIWLRVKVGLRA